MRKKKKVFADDGFRRMMMYNDRLRQQLDMIDFLDAIEKKEKSSNKNFTSEDYGFNSSLFFVDLQQEEEEEEKKWEFRKKMMKLLGIGAFVGGLLTAIVSYTCDFFGFSIDDTKDEINISSEVENG